MENAESTTEKIYAHDLKKDDFIVMDFLETKDQEFFWIERLDIFPTYRSVYVKIKEITKNIPCWSIFVRFAWNEKVTIMKRGENE